MLNSISIQNYALIKNLDIDLSPGLNVITGETGAGKSIIIDALSLLLGGRAVKDNIRADATKMTVSALFDFSDSKESLDILKEYGISLEDNQLVLTREIDKRSKNICRANGTIVPLNLFKRLGTELIDIHSQHETISLFKNESQRRLLDLYAGEEAVLLLATIRDLTAELKSLAKKIRELQKAGKEAARNQAIDKFQLDEIDKAALRENEDEELEEEVKDLEKGEVIFKKSYRSMNLLSNENIETASLSQLLSELSDEIEDLAKDDQWFSPYAEQMKEIMSQINSLSYDLSSYIDNLDYDPHRLEEIQSRLNEIDNLKKKYGDTISEILNYGETLRERLNVYENYDELLNETKKAYNSVRKNYNKTAKDLTNQRLQASEKLKAELEKELADLAMDKAVVKIDINTDPEIISSYGQETISFLISVNPGIEPRELKKVASGGEMSRIMLALKGIFGDKDEVGTMIFDEIDTGISGRTAQVVAEKITKLAAKRQIICITHLPQIAAMADSQFLVKKKSDDNLTEVSFHILDDESRIDELSRMLGGASVTELTKDSAREMIKQAQELKESFK